MTRAWLHLAGLGLHPERVRRLVAEHGGPDAVLAELGARPDPSVDPLAALTRAGISFLVRGEPGYPAVLEGLPDAPAWLYLRGAIPTAPMVAVVGSRRASAYGLDLARLIGARVAAAGWPVVSGLAAGVDGAAHRGCVEGGGVGVAVLGSGIDVWYPARNRPLGEQVLAADGAVVSEFPPGTRPDPWRFPCRNRIISGLAGAVVVVEAAERSGALITARLALDQGREVFAVPGDIGRPTSKGCNLLIRDGAHPVVGPDDLVEALELVLGPAPRPAPSPDTVLGGMVGEVPVPIDGLVERLARPVPEVLSELSRLEATGAVVVEGGRVRLRAS